MSAAPKQPTELTPDARIHRAESLLTEAIREMIAAYTEKREARSEWVDQDSSPLGRKRHLHLCRTKQLPCTPDGRRRLVRRADIDAYLSKREVIRVNVSEADDVEQASEHILRNMGH